MSDTKKSVDAYLEDIKETYGYLCLPVIKNMNIKMTRNKKLIFIISLVTDISDKKKYRLSLSCILALNFLKKLSNPNETKISGDEETVFTLGITPNSVISIGLDGSLKFDRIFKINTHEQKCKYYSNDLTKELGDYNNMVASMDSTKLGKYKRENKNKPLILNITPTFDSDDGSIISIGTHFSKIQLYQLGLFVKNIFDGFKLGESWKVTEDGYMNTTNNTSVSNYPGDLKCINMYLSEERVQNLYNGYFKPPSKPLTDIPGNVVRNKVKNSFIDVDSIQISGSKVFEWKWIIIKKK